MVRFFEERILEKYGVPSYSPTCFGLRRRPKLRIARPASASISLRKIHIASLYM